MNDGLRATSRKQDKSAAGPLVVGAAVRTINSKLGVSKGGLRLFGDPIQAIESDITASVALLSNGNATVAIVALDLLGVSPSTAGELKEELAHELDTSPTHVFLNFSHSHGGPDYGDVMRLVDTTEEAAARAGYRRSVRQALRDAAIEARNNARPARLGVGWGHCDIGVYRREFADGNDVLGEVPDHPIDDSVGVVRIDDLEGRPITTIFRYSAHPVTVGPRSTVSSTDFPGPARKLIEAAIGGVAIFLQGCGGNINATGIGYEVDCRDTKDRTGLRLGAEVVKVAAGLRTNTRKGERATFGSVRGILATPWVQVDDAPDVLEINAIERTVELDFSAVPSPAEAKRRLNTWENELESRIARAAEPWEIRTAQKFVGWARELVKAANTPYPTQPLTVQALRVGDLYFVGMDVEAFYETGVQIRASSPSDDTFVCGYTNGLFAYLPRAEDYPSGGWQLDQPYALPDLIPEAYLLPVALHPDSEQRAVNCCIEALGELA
jgi:hypothetical protein